MRKSMYVCVCKAVSERTIRRAVREEGVVSLRELSRVYGLGSCCGKCVPAAREILERELSAVGSPSAGAGYAVMHTEASAA